MSDPVIVVGAGFSGLSAACHLRRLGHEVTVFEAASSAGGRAGLLHHDGFRFDTGPTVVTMVDLLEDAFAAVDADLHQFCTLHRVDPLYRANFHDGSSLALHADLDAAADEIGRFAGPGEAAAFRRYVRWISDLYDAEFAPFIDRDLRSVGDLARHGAALSRLAALGGFRRWYHTVSRLFGDERLRRLFSFQAMYAGLSPLEALGMFAVIAYLDTVRGVYAPIGGTQALAEGLAAAAVKAGVTIHYDSPVAGVTPGRRPRVRLEGSGEEVQAVAVVGTPDLAVLYDDLLDLAQPRALRNATYAPSCLVWHVATRGELPAATAHHNIHFGAEWEGAFDDLLSRHRPMRDPSRFVTVASQSDPTAAPEGAHGLFVLEPTPNLDGDVDWARETPRLTERMLRWAHGAGYPTEGAEVVGVIDPPAWRTRGAARGTPFSLAHRFSQSGPFRPAPQDRRAPGVFFAGAGTRPGLGVPMVMISGRIAAERTDRYLRGSAQVRGRESS